MTILVTGAGGFVGRALVERLAGDGREVLAFDRAIPGFAARNVAGMEGDLADPAIAAALVKGDVDAIVHLAAVPGGAAEGDAGLSRRVNLDGTLNLIEAAARHRAGMRFVFASTIAVFGDPLPAEGVNDATPLRPRLIYGMHKAMIETAIATLTRRGAIDGVALRLPGIVARPAGAAGMKSAFMSDIFHAFRAGEPFTAPVSPEAQLWLMSLDRCVANLAHALTVDGTTLPEARVVTLPALRLSMAALAEAIGGAAGAGTTIGYAPDAALEAAFGAHPPLDAAAARRAGFEDDGSPAELVTTALAAIARSASGI